MSTWDPERIAKLRLARTHGVGPLTFQKLLRSHDTAAEALEALPERAKKAGRREIKLFPESDAEREIKATERFGAAVLFPGELDYPPLLAQLSPPPSILIVKGRLDLITSPSVAIVGARNASAAGLRMAKDLAVELGQRGKVIVSGLARGVDAVAHQAALNTGTMAVIAGGVDNRYPPQNAALQDQIYEHGLVVSENPFGYAPKARDFPKRNRLITGLANGTIVIEAAKRSGSLISARTASEQGRDVMAVPGSPVDARTHGSNALIRDGATLVQSADDVLESLAHWTPRQGQLFDTESHEFFDTDETADDISEDVRTRVMNALSPVPISISDIASAVGLSAPQCAALVTELELDGSAISVAGGLVMRA